MHLYLLARAEKDRLQKWINDLSAQWYPLQFKDRDGKILNGQVQLAVRPVQLYEVVFPASCEAEVMGTIRPTDHFGKWSKFIKWFSRLMGLNKPLEQEKWIFNKDKYVDNRFVHAISLGTKEDILQPFSDEEPKTEERI